MTFASNSVSSAGFITSVGGRWGRLKWESQLLIPVLLLLEDPPIGEAESLLILPLFEGGAELSAATLITCQVS